MSKGNITVAMSAGEWQWLQESVSSEKGYLNFRARYLDRIRRSYFVTQKPSATNGGHTFFD
jgi:hypothetical protein